MLLIEDILKFSTLSEREKFAFLSNLAPEDIRNLEDKYRRKFLEYGLDEWGFININIMRSSGYTENIENELLFDFSKE